MTIKSKLKTFFFLDDEYDDNTNDYREPVESTKPKQPVVKPKNVVSLQSVQKSALNNNTPSKSSSNSKMILVEPCSYSEATDIADQLRERRAVVVNLQRIDNEQGRQIIDFLSGVVYAIGGDMQKIGLSIFLCTPDNMEVSGNISDLIPDEENPNTRW